MPGREQTLDLLASVIGDKYEVLQWIGGGGMADVFLARHRLTAGFFAVKVLADRLAGDPGIVERFLQEARTAASLSGHANIVPIFDVGEAQGLYYIIMQYVEGEDLASYLARSGKLSPIQAVQVVIQIAKALVAAHAKGVVHRDLKPANIRLDRYGRVIVLDFGIAKAGDRPTALTDTGDRLGTPLYMAPEQVRGELCDARSDLYSLGVLFFEMLAGRRPFDGENHRTIEYGHLFKPAPSPAEVDPSIGPEFCRIVRRLLEKEPPARFQSAAELLEAVKALDVGRGTSNIQPIVAEEVRRVVESTPPPAAFATQARQPTRVTTRTRRDRRGLIAAIAAGVVVIATVVAVRSRQSKVVEDRVAPAPELASQLETPSGAMRLVPAGSFTSGDSSTESPNPPRTFFLPALYMDRTEVSNAAYKQFCDAAGRPYPDAPPWDANYFLGKPDHPVVNVTLADASAFAGWAGKRLPSEEEWEKAARGADARKYPWGNDPPLRQANLAGAADGFEHTAPVGSFPGGESPYGIRNLAGNVWEWTTTSFPATARHIADLRALVPTAGSAWNVIKGGSFSPGTTEFWLRCYQRQGYAIDSKTPYLGFRCVKDAK